MRGGGEIGRRVFEGAAGIAPETLARFACKKAVIHYPMPK